MRCPLSAAVFIAALGLGSLVSGGLHPSGSHMKWTAQALRNLGTPHYRPKGADLTESVRYWVVQEGVGNRTVEDLVASGKRVEVNYRMYLRGAGGRLTPGRHVFSQDNPGETLWYDHGSHETDCAMRRCGQNEITKGFAMIVDGMIRGERRYGLVPYRLAYGRLGNKELKVEPKEDLACFVEVLSVQKY